MATKLVPNKSMMRKFKLFFHPKKAIYQTFGLKTEQGSLPGIMYGTMAANIENLVRANNERKTVALMINDGTERNSSSVTRVTSVFIDCDGQKTTVVELLALPIVPDLIVESSPRNFHAYWLIKDCETTQFSAVMKALAAKLGSDPKVCDLPRVMRMAGTINHKYETPFLTTIIHHKKDSKPIRLKFFMRKMGLRIDVPKVARTLIADNSKPNKDKKRVRIIAALEALSPDDRGTWLKVGMAINSYDQSEAGFDIWVDWSKSSDKFDETEHRKTWDKFVVGNGVNIQSLFWLANLAKRGSAGRFDEASMAALFAEMYCDKLRYDNANKSWYEFNGVVWVANLQAPICAVREMILDLNSGKKESPVDNSIQRFSTVAGFKTIVAHAELLPEFGVCGADFDQNINLLAVKNGVIDLSTGQFRTALPSEYLRRQCNVTFEEHAKYPTWHRFLMSVTCRDKELYEFIRRVMGYMIFGHADMQLFFLALGTGRNGKGVLMRILKALLGEYAVNVLPNLLTSAYGGNANAPTPALAALCGARFVICTEMTGHKLDEAFIKQFAGGDELTVRNTYGAVFTFKPVGKLLISANYGDMPELSSADEAMWRRLVPIPFNAEYVKGENDDEKLEAALALEFSGILNWLLRGSKSYLKNGLGNCSAVDALKLKLRKDTDSLLAWMSACCVKDADDKTQSSVAHVSYTNFMRNNSSKKKVLGTQAFNAGLVQKGFLSQKTSKSNFFVGFRLIS